MTKFLFFWRKGVLWMLTVAVFSGVGYGGWRVWHARSATVANFLTQPVSRGDIVQTVSAQGTLNPVTLVTVGSQVSGRVETVSADFNSQVKSGQILAEIDPSLFQAMLRQDLATLSGAQASLKLAEAMRNRAHALYAKGYVALAALDQNEEAWAVAQAQVSVIQATVERDRTNLSYTKIRSPVSGVVVSRNVDVGQTVAASFQTPTLFTIAKDLRRMQIDTTVAEADIGHVREGQSVTFMVDAFPDQIFTGTVKQVRVNPGIQQNVVIYDVVAAVGNPELKLKPGMTAYVGIIIQQRRKVLRIPNAALRYNPAGGHDNSVPEGDIVVYRLVRSKAVPVLVRVGIADDEYSELLKGDLSAGDLLVTEDLQSGGSGEAGEQSGFHIRLF